MWDNPLFWRRFLNVLLAGTAEGRVAWRDNRPDEPRLATFFPDGMVHLVLPEAEASAPEVIVFGPWHETAGIFRPTGAEDLALVHHLWRLADQRKLAEGEDMRKALAGKRVIHLEEVYRDIEKELAGQPAGGVGTSAAVAKVGR